jgi:hypothetical protein
MPRLRHALAALAALVLALPAAAETPAGLFVSQAQLERAREAEGLADFLARAEGALDREPRPFAVAPEDLRFGWREPEAAPDDTLKEATERLHRGSSAMRDLALAFALTGQGRFADKAEALMLAWARESRAPNFYDYDPDFAEADLIGKTEGFGSDRPWNFGLDLMWQTYGLMNAADALLLLEHGGRALDPGVRDELEAWILRLTEAVNSGHHAWTRWADENDGLIAGFHHPLRLLGLMKERAGVARHRADNHLSWSLAGLLAGAAALEDDELAAYVLDGGAWEDRRAGRYANPSHIRDVIDRAIEPGGRVFDEKIGRSPPIGYALFHLEAMSLVARIAELHYGRDVWGIEGADGGGMLDAFRRYAPYLTGEARSPSDREREVRARWLFALSPPGYGGADRAALRAARPLHRHMSHAVGPARLLFGEGR